LNRSSFFSVIVCTGVLGSEVGFGGFGWARRLFLSLVLGHILEWSGVWEGVSLRSSPSIFPPTIVLLLVTMPHFRLDGLFDAFVGVGLQVLTCASPHGSDLGLS
jgi:hypothetical protein